jgi:hypothetical protein
MLYSLHVGVNKVDPNHYGTDAPLRGCENDARDMEAISSSLGYRSTVLLTKEATSTNFFKHLLEAERALKPGDYFLLTLACHGAQVADASGDENDRKDETWCLYDRMIIDDEIYTAFRRFREGVKIFVVSDSCHSGTSTRMLFAAMSEGRSLLKPFQLPHDVRIRCIEPFMDRGVFDKFKGGLQESPKSCVQEALQCDRPRSRRNFDLRLPGRSNVG